MAQKAVYRHVGAGRRLRHDPDTLIPEFRIADRGYIIVHGEIVVAADSVDELRGNDIVKRLYLGGIA